MNYTRIIPRDLFNEAALLRDLGKLACLDQDIRTTVRNLVVEFTGKPGEPFDIAQDTDSGAIRCANVEVRIMGYEVPIFRPLNSRHESALYAELPEAGTWEAQEVEVFGSPRFTPSQELRRWAEQVVPAGRYLPQTSDPHEIKKRMDLFRLRCRLQEVVNFGPDDGKCWSCGKQIFSILSGWESVTGCPFCHRTYCD